MAAVSRSMTRYIYLDGKLSPPERIGHFSVSVTPDGQSEVYHSDKSFLTFLHPNPSEVVGTDLSEGFDHSIKWDRPPLGEMQILRWINENREKCHNQTIDFISHSERPFQSILATSYIDPQPNHKRDKWLIIAVKVGSSIILNEIETDLRLTHVAQKRVNRNRFAYSMYKFANLITHRSDGSQPVTHPEGIRDSFSMVNRWKVNQHTLLFSNKVNCARNQAQLDKPLDETDFVLIKTHSKYVFYNDDILIERTIFWWIASLLSRTDSMIIGAQEKPNRVSKVFRTTVSSFMKRFANSINDWPEICVNYLDKILTQIKSTVNEELVVYRFELAKGTSVVCRKTDEPVENFIPSWYINGQSPDQ